MKPNQQGFALITIAALLIAFTTIMAATLGDKMAKAPIEAQQTSTHKLSDISAALSAYAMVYHQLPLPAHPLPAGGHMVKGGVPDELAQYGALDRAGVTYTVNQELTVKGGVASEHIPHGNEEWDFILTEKLGSKLNTQGMRLTKFDNELE